MSHAHDQSKLTVHEAFRRFAARAAEAMGSPVAFALAVLLVLGWAAIGPAVAYSADWELVINTLTTIITFLMVFLIQNAQNRDARAVQLKLDELLRAVRGARTGLVRLEELTDDQLAALRDEFERLHDSTVAKAPSGQR